MKKNKIWIFAILILTTTLFSSCGKIKWLTSFEEAKKQAQKNGKDIFMVVSENEETSAEFKTSVLDSKEFLSAAKKNYVPLYINLSAESLANLTQEELEKTYAENSKIILEYSITEKTTMLLLSPEGYWLAEFPYTEKYLSVPELLKDLTNSDDTTFNARNYISSIKKSDGTDKAKAINDLYDFTKDKYRMPLISLCYDFLNLDSENSTGLLGKYELIVAYDQAEKVLSEKSVDDAAEVFIQLAENGHLDRSQIFEAYFTAAYLYPLVGSTDFDKMLELLNKAYSSNPTDIHASEATDLIQSITDMKLLYENSSAEEK